MKIRIKFGKNPYGNDFTCAHCRRKFSRHGIVLRIEHARIVVDVPICQTCFEKYGLFEGIIDMSKHNTSHRIGLA